jgi:hypothetical protein
MPEHKTPDARPEESEIGKIRHRKKRAFLAAVANAANIVRAAEIAGIDRDYHYIWRKKDSEYAAAFEIAWKRGTDALEAEAVRRAFEGVAKPIFHGGKRAIDVVQNPDGSVKRDKDGKPVGIPAAVREYSDTLLIFLLKGCNPAVFGDRVRQEHSGDPASPLTFVVRDIGKAAPTESRQGDERPGGSR